MKAIIIEQYGGPEKLAIQNLPEPEPKPGNVVIAVKAFGINHAETHMRKGEWAEAAKVSGIECVGVVKACPGGEFNAGQKVAAFMGGMGRTINGSYAEYTSVPVSNVVAIESELSWAELAAIPESYATAWTCLHRNLELKSGHTLVLRGATSALGQAALNIAAHAGANVIATTRSPDRAQKLTALGARRVGRVCLAGFLGGLAPVASFNPLLEMPSSVKFSFFGSFVFGALEFPVSDIPFQEIVDRVAAGEYQANPARVFRFEEIQDAHRLMESNQANGKIVVSL